MVSHKELCRGIFKERILPAFPHAKDRFEKHFDDAYHILREIRPHYIISDPTTWIVQRTISLELSFTILGLKPLTLFFGWERKLISEPVELTHMLTEAGLEIRRSLNLRYLMHVVEVYDPELVQPILEKILGPINDVNGALKNTTESTIMKTHFRTNYFGIQPQEQLMTNKRSMD